MRQGVVCDSGNGTSDRCFYHELGINVREGRFDVGLVLRVEEVAVVLKCNESAQDTLIQHRVIVLVVVTMWCSVGGGGETDLMRLEGSSDCEKLRASSVFAREKTHFWTSTVTWTSRKFTSLAAKVRSGRVCPITVI